MIDARLLAISERFSPISTSSAALPTGIARLISTPASPPITITQIGSIGANSVASSAITPSTQKAIAFQSVRTSRYFA